MTNGVKGSALAKSPGASLALNSVDDLNRLAELLYKGGLTPPGIDSPAKVAAVVLAGLEVGLPPTQALGSIMLTNGRFSIYGDGALALVRASALLESISEVVEGDGAARAGKCTLKRKGEPERTFTFTMGQAEKAGLIERAKGKGPWASYPDRMLVMRARGFALRDVFPDALRGLITHEEAQDIVDTEVKVVSITPAAAPESPPPPPALPPAAPAPEAAARFDGPASVAPPHPDGPVTDAQREDFLTLRGLVCAAAGANDDESRRAAWAAALAPFGVASVAQLTAGQAAHAIFELSKVHQPF